MTKTARSIGTRICLFLSFLSIVYTLYAALDPIYSLDFTGRFTAAATFVLPLGIASLLIAHPMADEKKQRVYHIFWWILFLYYLAQLLYMLFFASEFYRQDTPLFEGHYLENLKQQWNLRSNLKPFYTIHLMMNAYANHMQDLAVVNLLGNIVAFMPFAFFLPKLFPSMKKSGKFLGFMCSFIILVEVTQLLTMSGTLDIDDFILNMSGTGVLYFMLKLPLCRRLTICHKPYVIHPPIYVKKEIHTR